MSQRSTDTLQFRGVDERTLDDQLQAAREGYGSVQDMAINELAARIIRLEQRVDELERAPRLVPRTDEAPEAPYGNDEIRA